MTENSEVTVRAEKEINVLRFLTTKLVALHDKYVKDGEDKHKDPYIQPHPRDPILLSINMSSMPIKDIGKFLGDFHKTLQEQQLGVALSGFTCRAVRPNDRDTVRALKKHLTLNLELTTFLREELAKYVKERFPEADKALLLTLPDILDHIEADLGAQALEHTLGGEDVFENSRPRERTTRKLMSKEELDALVTSLGLEGDKADHLRLSLSCLAAR